MLGVGPFSRALLKFWSMGREMNAILRHFLFAYLALLPIAPTLFGQTNPIPFVSQPVVPLAIAPGSSGFTLIVNGAGFVAGSTIDWNNAALITTFVNSSQLTAMVPAANVATAGTAVITVVNPSPGGGISNAQYLQIATPVTTLNMTSLPTFGFKNPIGGGLFASGDFNGDGKLDVVGFYPTGPFSDQMCTYLGNGDGSFQSLPCTFPDNNYDFTPIAGDFNGDGKLDIIVGTCTGSVASSCSFAVFLGNGDGTFQSPITSGTPGPQALVELTGDFNRDGKLDVVISVPPPNSGGNPPSTIELMLGKGDGTFQDPTTVAINGVDVTAGDLNGDGILDLAISPSTILLGNGDGTFTNASGSPTFVEGVTIADMNGDGKPDLVSITNSSTCTISVFLGNGNGTFQPPISTAQQQCYLTLWDYLIVTDFNGDGKLDAMTLLAGGTSLPQISFGNGDGSFQAITAFPPEPQDTENVVAVADFNGDGRPDLLSEVLASNQYLQLFIQGSYGTISFSPASVTFAGQYVGTLAQPQNVSVANNGTSNITFSSVTASPPDFSIQNGCSNVLAPGYSCTIEIGFDPTTGGPITGALTLTDTAYGGTQTLPLTGAGQDFSTTSSSSSQTISAGQTTTYSLSVTPLGAFTDAVQLSCTGAPASTSCMVPQSVTLNGTSASTVTVTVTSLASSAMNQSAKRPPLRSGSVFCIGLGGCLGLILWTFRNRSWPRRRSRVFLAAEFAFSILLMIMTLSCSTGSRMGGTGGLQPGTYNLTVTGSFTTPAGNTLRHTAKLTLIVQ